MAVLPIRTWPDPILSQVCAPAELGPELSALARDMLDTMYDAPGRGLAAPQVGRSIRLFVMDVDWKEGDRSPMVFVNPTVLATSDELATHDEGCLSIPGVMTSVKRPAWVRMSWTDFDGTGREAVFDGIAAVCVQHEADHLDGIVTFDRLDTVARAVAEAEYAA